ncbi:D-amino-acid transaminase [Paenibacillus athensensis]|uniref:D-alanine aminotransferase n=1 Tax=Paenibacillus athensensis TaxID=1967502 RepID=A0A4Y8PRR5_9BACL|nr:D-amino-acid transaminase [Paenibacillus athensensis]MCD1259290.1 D-amino-acid transaminase [Paenibacillus athensensis]
MYFFKDRFMTKDEVRISPDDRGYYFGDGVYEVFRIYGGKLYEKEAHMRRLENSARELRLPLPYSLAEISDLLERLTAQSELDEATLYMQITRGEAVRSHPFPAGAESVLMAYCSEVDRPTRAMQSGISAVTQDDIRWLRCDLKTLNLLPNVLAKQKAMDHGVQEVVLHRNGTVTECSASNVMIVADGMLLTHPANHLILHGITRGVVLELARGLGLRVREEAFGLDELLGAEEVFITGTTVEVTPLVRIDGQPIGSGEPGIVTRRLQTAFEATFSA